MTSIYDRVKAKALKENRSISSIEKEAGIANGVIAGWQEGKPYAESLRKVATVLGVTMEELMEDTENTKEAVV